MVTTQLGGGDPVTVMDVSRVVLEAIAAKFEGRLLDCHTARHGVAHAAFTLIEMELRKGSAAY